MSIQDKLIVFYLIGVVVWTVITFMALKRKNVKNYELMSAVFGILWGFFVPYNIVKIILESRHEKVHHR